MVQRVETQQNEANQKEMSDSAIVPCTFDGFMSDDVYERRQEGEPPKWFASPGRTDVWQVDRVGIGRDLEVRRISLSLPVDNRDTSDGPPYHECTLASWAS